MQNVPSGREQPVGKQLRGAHAELTKLDNVLDFAVPLEDIERQIADWWKGIVDINKSNPMP